MSIFFYDPFVRLAALHRHLNGAASLGLQADWWPACDLQENDKELSVHLELPGLTKDNITIEVRDGMLVVRGRREAPKKQDNQKTQVSDV